MDIYNYLKNNQPTAFSLFKKALSNDSFFHAYLFVGQTGSPLLEVAEFLAKSIIQNKKTFYKYDELLEKQIKENNLSNFILLDGRSSNNIKIDEIRNLEASFSTTSTDKFHKKIYIINLVENMKDNATNTLLKFLEEPPADTYAFFTTENEFKVLATIKSRTQIIKLNPVNKEDILNSSKDEDVSDLDAYLLSSFNNNVSMYPKLSKSDSFKLAKKGVLTFIENLNNPNKLYLNMEMEFITTKKDLVTTRQFFDMLIYIFKDAFNYKISKNKSTDTNKHLLVKIIDNINNIDKAILLLMNLKEELNYNININLLLTYLITEIIKL